MKTYIRKEYNIRAKGEQFKFATRNRFIKIGRGYVLFLYKPNVTCHKRNAIDVPK